MGLYLTERLKKANMQFNCIRRSSPNSLSRSVRVPLFKISLLSKKFYASPRWFATKNQCKRIEKLQRLCLKWCYKKHEINDEDYVLYLKKSKLLPISLTVFKNELILLNKILNNELPINVLDFWTVDKGPESHRTGNKTFLRMPMKPRSKLCENFFYRVAETSNSLARSNNLPGHDPFQEPVILRKNLNLFLVGKLQTFRSSISPYSRFLSLFY